jgi:hypothetical protein
MRRLEMLGFLKRIRKWGVLRDQSILTPSQMRSIVSIKRSSPQICRLTFRGRIDLAFELMAKRDTVLNFQFSQDRIMLYVRESDARIIEEWLALDPFKILHSIKDEKPRRGHNED